MAYVAISQNLINSTQNNIIKMRDKEKAAVTAPPERMPMSPKSANLELLVWGDHLHLRDQMPEDWKTTVSRVNAKVEFDAGKEDKNNFEFVFDLTDPMEVPTSKNQSYYGFTVVVGEDSHLLPLAVRDAVANNKFRIQTNDKWADIKDKVTKFLGSAKSLNEALKLWPALALYVSDEFVDRVNNNPKREKMASKAEEIMASISIDELTAAAVASKLTV